MGGNGGRRYDWETKVAAARDHVENGMTKTEVMARHGITSVTPLERWCREYRAGGPEALRPSVLLQFFLSSFCTIFPQYGLPVSSRNCTI
ncbi:transposase [Bifidobacterium longum subsp. longum]|nr:transposase [Bifidobacterium longum subsp. longum]